MTTFIDSNVLLDVFMSDADWGMWSSGQLMAAINEGRCAINAIVYAETSTNFSHIDHFDDVLATLRADMEEIPSEAAFVAGKAFQAYRRSGGPRQTLLPDFLIGAHAAVQGYTLLTRDARRYRTYFPKLKIIAP
jgi:predicted nucleic acid-binding protein